jgi:putative transposase
MSVRERLKASEYEVRELRQANEILRKASAYDHREVYGAEPICKVLPIASSTYYRHAACQAHPNLRSARAKQYESLGHQIRRIWEENFQAYGARKVWRQLQREGKNVARCTVERLMRQLGLQGVVRGKTVKTTISRPDEAYPLDRVNRQFTAARPLTPITTRAQSLASSALRPL